MILRQRTVKWVKETDAFSDIKVKKINKMRNRLGKYNMNIEAL